MTENENMNLRVNRETIEMVTEKIRSVVIIYITMNDEHDDVCTIARRRMQSKTFKLCWK